MNKSILIGIISCLLVVIIFGVLIYIFAKPKEEEVRTSAKQFKEIPAVFREEVDLSALTAGLEKNGEFPVSLPPEKFGREDPFAGL